MSAASSNPCFGTPTLWVRSNRGAAVRTLRYNRQSAEDALEERIEGATYDALGRETTRIDARFFGAAGSPAPNFAYLSSLSGQVLHTDSIDAGTRCTLPDVDGRPVWAHDGRGTTTTFTYDELGRLLAVQEVFDKQPPTTRDRCIYGENQPDAQTHNLRGRCVFRYDTAGRLAWSGFRLTGQPIAETRQLLANAEADPDWSDQTPAALAGALDATVYRTAWTHDATGAWIAMTDAKRNVQQLGFDVAGRLAGSSLTLADGTVKPVLSAIDYSAAGQVLSATAGNGAVSTRAYEPQTQRLVGLTVTRPAQSNRATIVQDLSYTYDPVGNVVRVSDGAQAISYSHNQKIEPACLYGYDALYQLINATGREMANRGAQGHTLPAATVPLPSDDSVYANYTRTYTYDRGGNLTAIRHQGAANYTQSIVVSDRSNHAMQQDAAETLMPADIDTGGWFDTAGNPQRLVPDATQPLEWDRRDRLQRVTLVKRSGADDDREAYQYGGDGMRVRKRMTTQTGGTTRTVDVIYLPGVTLRVTSSQGKAMNVVESLQEISSQAGGIQARCLHWETGQPANLDNDAVRYGMGDRNGSIGLELDDQASLISREEYYPYGGTAVWTARSRIEADKKFVRYSGKERDATGLYDYGYRYYQPWIGRWLNTDPAGTVDGLNLYRMVENNPVSLRDQDGLAPTPPPLLEENDIDLHLDLIDSFVASHREDLAGWGGVAAEDVAAYLGDAGSATPTYPTAYAASGDESSATDSDNEVPMHAGPSSAIPTMDWTDAVQLSPTMDWTAFVQPSIHMTPWSRPDTPGPSTSGATHHAAPVHAAGPLLPAMGPQATAAGRVNYDMVMAEARALKPLLSQKDYEDFFGQRNLKASAKENNDKVLALLKVLDKYKFAKITDVPGAPIMAGDHKGASGHTLSQGKINTSKMAHDLGMPNANYFHDTIYLGAANPNYPWKRKIKERLELWARKLPADSRIHRH